MATVTAAEVAANITLDEFKQASYEKQQDHMLATLAALFQHRDCDAEDKEDLVETILRKFTFAMQGTID
jgi:hypothetical protein